MRLPHPPMLIAVMLLGLAAANPASAGGMLSGLALAHALKEGGYVILMRHASAPPMPPAAADREADNVRGERQLDQAGKDGARAMGAAFRTLGIAVGAVYCSPTYRARQTARLAGFRDPRIEPELGDGGTSMSPQSVAGWAGSLKAQVAIKPRPGVDTVIVTQYPNIASVFPDAAKGLGDGGALVIRPDGKNAIVVARVQMADWARLAGQ